MKGALQNGIMHVKRAAHVWLLRRLDVRRVKVQT